jgi:tetratricopeptide (TPR) repeat protein
MDGLSTKEISEFLGIPDGTVESRLHRAKAQLRENIALIESALSRQRLGTDFAQKLMDEANRLSSEPNFSFKKKSLSKRNTKEKDENQKYRRAIQLYQRVVESWPDSEYANNAKNLIGINYVRLGELDKAIELYESALREERENIACRYYLGKAYYERGDYEKALVQYNLIVENNKQLNQTARTDEKVERQFRMAWFNSALCYEKLGKLAAARATYEDFLKQFTKGELTICAMVALKRLSNRKDLSSDELREIRKLTERAYHLFQRKTYLMAIKICQSVIHRFPTIIYVAQAHTVMGRSYQQMGETKKAVETFKKELAHYAQIGSRCRLAQAYEAHGDVTHALEDYAKALAEYQIIIRYYPDARPSDLRRAWRGSGNCYKKLGRLDEAKAAYNAAMEIKGDDDVT